MSFSKLRIYRAKAGVDGFSQSMLIGVTDEESKKFELFLKENFQRIMQTTDGTLLVEIPEIDPIPEYVKGQKEEESNNEADEKN